MFLGEVRANTQEDSTKPSVGGHQVYYHQYEYNGWLLKLKAALNTIIIIIIIITFVATRL